MNGLTDEEIVRRIHTGEKRLFGEIMERYEERLKRYAKKFLLGYEEADDLTQDVFIKAYTHIHSFDPERKFSSWIYRIAHNEAINTIKKKKREPLGYFDMDVFFPQPRSAHPADREVKENELTGFVADHLGKLAPKYREPLVLYYFEDLSYQEIADIMHIPVATVGVRINRAKKTLKEFIGSYE